MSGEVNRVPLGLLSLLDMTARGQVPRSLDERLSASVELQELYLANARIRRGSTTTITVPGHFTLFTVPENEIWWVHNLSFSTGVLAAATELVWTAGVRVRIEGGGTQQVQVLGETQPRFLAGDVATCRMSRDHYLALPGDLLGPIANDLVLGTAPNCIATADITILRI